MSCFVCVVYVFAMHHWCKNLQTRKPCGKFTKNKKRLRQILDEANNATFMATLKKICYTILLRSSLIYSLSFFISAALQSVFPQTELGTFMALVKNDKERQLVELTLIVSGIRLFNKECGKGGEGIDDCKSMQFMFFQDTDNDLFRRKQGLVIANVLHLSLEYLLSAHAFPPAFESLRCYCYKTIDFKVRILNKSFQLFSMN